MKLSFDLQAVQTEGSRHRGIGRYSLNLCKAILNNNLKHAITLNLSKLYSDSVEKIFGPIQSIKSIPIVKYSDLIPIAKGTSLEEKNNIRRLNSYLLKQQLWQQNADLIHIHSIFEGLGGDAVVPESLNELYGPLKSVTLYDLIPLVYKDTYLNGETVKSWYYKKLHLLYEVDLILSISESARKDAINYLGIPPEKIVNISGAISSEFHKINCIDTQITNFILKQYGIRDKFILYTGGIDFRKNLPATIAAFSKISSKLLKSHQLVIVCSINDNEKKVLEEVVCKYNLNKSSVVFTGYISDEELNILYNTCDLFVFPSLYEGFGLPVLEAMSCGAAVIASNTSSIPEIVSRKDCLFDPTNSSDITKKIESVLLNSSYKSELKEYLYKESMKFSWDNSALKAIEAFEDLSNKKVVQRKQLITTVTRRKKMAYFSPLPDIKSGIADYSNQLLPFISNYFDIDLYIDDYEVTADILNNTYQIYSYRQFEVNAKYYDVIIYQVGNSSYHQYMYDLMLTYPGIVVLHDFYLSGLINYYANSIGDLELYFNEIRYSHSEAGENELKKYFNNEISIHDLIQALPANKKIINNARGIIVHSKHSSELLNEFYPDIKGVLYEKVNFPSAVTNGTNYVSKNEAKVRLGISIDTVLISTFGYIADTKRNDYIVKCLSELDVCHNSNIKIAFVGELLESEYAHLLRKQINDCKISDKITITGYVDTSTYNMYIIATDIAINLREKTRGESSASLINLLASGIPTMVSDYASFKEYPDNVVVKIDNNSSEDFKIKFFELLNNTQLRLQLSENAVRYINENHRIDVVSQEYVVAVHNILNHGNKTKLKNMVSDVADIVRGREFSDEVLCDTAVILNTMTS